MAARENEGNGIMMKKCVLLVAAVALVATCLPAGAAGYYVADGFETVWAGDYAPGWVNMQYRWGPPPIGKMMQQVDTAHSGSYGMKLFADSVPENWMWFAGVDPVGVNAQAMTKQYDPWFSAWYYDEGTTGVAGQITAVPSWVVDDDWTDVQFGARFAAGATSNYYEIAQDIDGSDTWQAAGVRSVGWHQLKMQLSSADGKIHFYLDGVEVGASTRNDYVDLGSEIGLYTMFQNPLSGWGDDKPYTIWDDVEFGSSIPEPMTMLAVASAVMGLAGYIRRRRMA
jgi:hypothetical protein